MAMMGKIRSMHFRQGKSISEIARLTSLSRNTIKKWPYGVNMIWPPRIALTSAWCRKPISTQQEGPLAERRSPPSGLIETRTFFARPFCCSRSTSIWQVGAPSEQAE